LARFGLAAGEAAKVVGAPHHAFEPADPGAVAAADVAERAAVGTDVVDIDRAFQHAVGGVDVQIAAPGIGQLGIGEHALPEGKVLVVNLRVDMFPPNGAAEIRAGGFDYAVAVEDTFHRRESLRIGGARAPIDVIVEFTLFGGDAAAA